MKAEHLIQFKNEHNHPCVSVIIPTHKTASGREPDMIEAARTIARSKELLINKYGKNGSAEIIRSLDNLTEKIDFTHNENGLGLFVSPTVSEIIRFPFPVEEKITVSENFDIRDLLYMTEYLSPYLVLAVSLESIRLYNGAGQSLTELKDDVFPVVIYDDYEYERAALGSSYGYSLKGTEKDKSISRNERFMAFLKKADHALSHYLNNNTPFIITGGAHELGEFMQITVNSKKISGKVSGNYNKNLNHLGELTFEEIKKHRVKNKKSILTNLKNAYGKNLAVVGLRDCWKAAQEGKGLLLIVEKDYRQKGYLKEPEEYKLELTRPDGNYKMLNDAVEELIKIVLGKKGNVVFVENNSLADYQKIALIERYA